MLQPGDRVERYEVEAVLGEGGMARVYRVRHTTLNTAHALKVLTLTGPSLKERLYEEGKTQARLRHPNIVRVTDVLEVQGMPGLVMDFIDGPDLHTWIRTELPGPELAEQVFRDVVAGVAAAHDADMIHRDLKPANVLMSRDASGRWVPRVADFGLVKALAGDTQSWKTRSGIPMGTPTYMAPEQIRDAANVDHRADIFSLGCILYELITHQVAHEAEDLVSIFEKVQDGRRDPLPPGTPTHLAHTVERCLQLDPDARPADCAAVLELLDAETAPVPEAGAAEPTMPDLDAARVSVPSAPSPPTIAPPSPTRHAALVAAPVAVLAVGVLAVGLLGGVVAGVFLFGGLDPEGPCPDSGGVLGYVEASGALLPRREGATYRVRSDSPVLDDHPDGEQVCVLLEGSRVTLVEDEIRQDGRWILVRGDALEPPADDEPDEAEAPADEAEEPEPEPEPRDPMAGPCPGPEGEVVGWANAKPFLHGQGATWTLLTSKSVYGDYPRKDNDWTQGPVVCELEAGTMVDLVEAPERVRGSGAWIPIVAGAIR